MIIFIIEVCYTKFLKCSNLVSYLGVIVGIYYFKYTEYLVTEC